MSAKKNILSICFSIVTILFVGVLYLDRYSMLGYSGIKKNKPINPGTGAVFMPDKKNPPIVSIPMALEAITSERYLFTLQKNIESRLSILLGTGVILGNDVQMYESISKSGSVFIFKIQNTEIDFPISSYFFDIWNSRSTKTVSGEISIHTGSSTGSNKKVIALTFDDGPSPKFTNILLDILKKENVRATFFVLGSKAEQYPLILKREHYEGHEIGSHSWNHILYTKLSNRDIQEDIYRTDQAIFAAIGKYTDTFRPPYGGLSIRVLENIPMPSILWSIDTRDWQTLSIRKNVLSVKNAKDGDIIIMHDIHEASVNSVAEIIYYLRDQGFSFVTVSELLEINPSNPQIGKKCSKKNNCK